MDATDAQSHRTGNTGVSRRSSQSRASQLIKKNTGPLELRPSDVLIDRFTSWKTQVKSLIAYFEGVADIERNTATELAKLGGVIQVPFRQGNQFLGEGGMQDIFYGIREKTRVIADHHASLGKTVEMSIVQHLQKLRAEIKAHIRNIQMDTGKLANIVAKEREMSTKVITDLARSITMLKNTPMNVTAREDPWYTNMLVMRQLQKQVNEENALQKSIIIMQQNSAHFEEGVVRAIQTAWETFDSWQSRMAQQVQESWGNMGVLMKSIQPNTEWIAFAARSDHLLDPETPLRNPDHINYPGKDDPSVLPVHQGILERKKRYTKAYKEGYYVLTPAGYLHEHRSSDITKHAEPELSLFLPECTLGAPSSLHARSHKFHIEGKKGSPLTRKSGSFSLSREHAYTFRARSHDELMEWWNDAKQLSKVYLTSSESMDRSGPVPAAVRAAGYLSEEEEEEGGSSMEEEEDDEEEEEEESETEEEAATTDSHARQSGPGPVGNTQLAPPVAGQTAGTDKEDAAPSYSGPATGSGINIGQNGYAEEKKALGGLPDAANAPGPDAPSSADATPAQPSTSGEGTGTRFKEEINSS